jgi:hypothetical protein
MALVVRQAGTINAAIATPFTVNNISATVVTSGLVGLTAGTSVIGDINAISRTVQVAIGTPFTIQGISTTVQVAIGTPFTDNNISAAVVLAAGTANIGFINNISATVNVAFAGGISLAAGTSNIGFINNISATVVTGLSYVIEKTSNSQVQVGDSANAAIRVNVVAGSSGGVSQVDGTTFSTQAANFVPMGGIFDDATPDTLSENDAGVVRLTTNRAMHINLRTDGGVKLEDSANSALRVNIVAGGGSGGTSQTDGTSFTAQAALFTPIGGVFDDATPDTLSENDAGVVRMTTNRAFHVNFRDTTGAELGAASATGIFIRTATIALAADQILGSISRTVQVAIGTPFTVNNISATVVVSGTVSLGASTANIGTINNISAAVVLAAGTANIGSINNISAAIVLAAGSANIGSINNISAAVVLAAGAANIGSINNISATVTVAGIVNSGPTGIISVSHGPKSVVVSTSAAVSLITGPGVGLSVYITQLAVTNGGTINSLARIGTSADGSTIQMFCASAGGGFVLNFNPPWKLSASEAAVCSVKPNTSGNTYFNVNFYVAA